MFTLKNKSLLLILIITTLTGCEQLIDIDPPLNEISSEVVYKSDNTAKSVLSGLYSRLSQTQTQLVRLTLNGALSADELTYTTTGVSYEEFMSNTLDPVLSSSVGEVWTEFYGSIYRSNSMIEGLEKYTGTTAAVNKQLKAEAKFLRAYCYFYLVNLFGDIPLVSTTDVTVTSSLPRAPASQIYELILKDLTEAKADLLEDYAASGGNRHNANKYAATALLARVQLYLKQYGEAEKNASEVIAKTSLYGMISSASMGTGVFVKNSREAIFQFMSWGGATNNFTYEGQSFVTTSAQWDLHPTLVSAFETGDLRKKNWVNAVTISGKVYNQPFKYKYRNNALAVAAGVTEYPTILRLAEQYLIRAEARANLDNIVDARTDMNVIRLRAGLTESVVDNKAALLLEIENERRKELFCELSHRWLDLKRTDRADAVLSPLKPTWKATARLYPIPQTARDANTNLSQNTGYAN